MESSWRRAGYHVLLNLTYPSLFDKYSSTFPSLEDFVYLNIRRICKHEFLGREKRSSKDRKLDEISLSGLLFQIHVYLTLYYYTSMFQLSLVKSKEITKTKLFSEKIWLLWEPQYILYKIWLYEWPRVPRFMNEERSAVSSGPWKEMWPFLGFSLSSFTSEILFLI